MELQIIQLSDIHFKSENNSILEKQDFLFDSIKNETSSSKKTIFLVTGDSTFSGKETEFQVAKNFYNDLINRLYDYNNTEAKFIIVPGNHDNSNLTKDDQVRKILLNAIQQPETKTDLSTITKISENLNNYFVFLEEFNNNLDVVFTSILLNIYRLETEELKVLFYCYNTAFQSVLNEVPGKMIFPLELLEKKNFSENADLKISCFHHPFHWLNPKNNRLFKEHIEITSDIVFTGHEHYNTKSKLTDLEGNVIYQIEGDVLQESDNNKVSGFNIIDFKLKDKLFRVINKKWNGERYISNENTESWKSFERGKINLTSPYSISSSFINYLEDVGANFSHPNIGKVKLSDVYVFPYFERLPMEGETIKDINSFIISAKSVLKSKNNKIRFLISGNENIGKTSFLKKSFIYYHTLGLIPILVDGRKLSSSSSSKITNVLSNYFLEQYKSDLKEDFTQLDKSKLILLIDDFDQAKINSKYKTNLVNTLINEYENIILIGNELMSLEEMITNKNNDDDIFSSFKIYNIKEFGFKLRSELINKWIILGVESTITEEEKILKHHNAERLINKVTGINFVPSYPFFILTILQTIELNNEVDLSSSAFGSYYQFLINRSLSNFAFLERERTEYYNYLSELAFHIFETKTKEFDMHFIEDFDSNYRNKFTISHSLNKITQNLINNSIIANNINGILTFKYSYLYYYFIAHYLSKKIENRYVKSIISSLAERLHVTEFSNIIMFLTHHTNNRFLLYELLSKAKSLFNDLKPCELQNDIKVINEFVDQLPKLVFKSRPIDEYLKEKYEHEDIIKASKDSIEEMTADENSIPDINENINEIDIIAKVNTVFKSMEIIGQIIKNNYGKIENKIVLNLINETMYLGLRTLGLFFELLIQSNEFLTSSINSIVANFEASKGKPLDKKRIERISKNFLFNLSTQIAYVFIKKISNSIGAEHLNKLLNKSFEKLDVNSVKLIKLAVKLDYYHGFPIAELKVVKNDLAKYYLPTQVMNRLVINNLYIFPTNRKQKSQILSLIGISTENQIKIYKKSKQKKK